MVLIVGATGQLGSKIAHKLLAQGRQVRAFVRKTSDFQALQKAGAQIAFGDLKEPETLQAACDGVKRVVTTASASLRAGSDTIENVDQQGTQDLIDAARSARVEQFVYVSAYGFSPEAPIALARAKGLNEIHLQNSGLTYTILKPVNFMESWIGFVIGTQLQQGPAISIVGDGNLKHGFVAMENVADIGVAVLGNPAAENAMIALNGPRSVSYREILALIERSTGQSIEIHSIAPGEEVPGMPPIVSELWQVMVKTGDVELDSTEVAKTYGITLLGVEDFIQSTFSNA